MELKEEKDLYGLITHKIPEDTNLDYKDPQALIGSKNGDIAKDISAMANSDGGIIIYGISEDQEKMPNSIKWISDRSLKEKVAQVCQSRIVPHIEGIVYDEITSDEDKGKFVLIVRIPKSYNSPHQTHLDNNAKRYYGRNGSVTRELEHHEVESLFFRRKGPMLKLYFDGDLNAIKGINYTINLVNEGKSIAEKIMMTAIIPYDFEISGPGNSWTKTLDVPGQYKVFQFFDDKFPCYPEVPSQVGRLYHPDQNKIVEGISVSARVMCKEMNVRKFVLTVTRGELSTEIFDGGSLSTPSVTYLN